VLPNPLFVEISRKIQQNLERGTPLTKKELQLFIEELANERGETVSTTSFYNWWRGNKNRKIYSISMKHRSDGIRLIPSLFSAEDLISNNMREFQTLDFLLKVSTSPWFLPYLYDRKSPSSVYCLSGSKNEAN